MGEVARNSLKGYTYQQSVFILFLGLKGCIFSEPAKLLNFLTTDGSKDTGF